MGIKRKETTDGRRRGAVEFMVRFEDYAFAVWLFVPRDKNLSFSAVSAWLLNQPFVLRVASNWIVVLSRRRKSSAKKMQKPQLPQSTGDRIGAGDSRVICVRDDIGP